MQFPLELSSRQTAWMLGVALACATLTAAQGQSRPGTIPNRYIVRLQDGQPPQTVARQHALAPDLIYSGVLDGFAANMTPAKAQALGRDARVASIRPDRRVFALTRPGGGRNPRLQQTVPAGVRRIGAAPGQVNFTGAGVGVAIVDTGLDFGHADLQPLGTSSFSAFGAGPQDDEGHGTHVAGVIAARNNNLDVVGVAPEATLYAVKVLDGLGEGTDSTVLAGLDWIAQNAGGVKPPIRVVNMSLGRDGAVDDNPDLHAAIRTLVAMNITVVVAAGNDCSLETAQQIPAAYPEVIAVASTTAADGANLCPRAIGPIKADAASSFTTDGAGVAISAPGEEREDRLGNCVIQSLGILSTRLGGGTTRGSGTSVATPHVTGAVALLWQKALASGQPLTPASALNKLQTTASGKGTAPLDNPDACYSFDGQREGVLHVPTLLQ